jgi:hypothetical protein
MSQHVTPGDLAGTVGATKGRVSRLERELSNLRRTSEQPTMQQVLVAAKAFSPSAVFSPGVAPDFGFVVFHPTGANLLSVTFIASGPEDDKPPLNAVMSIQTAGPGSVHPLPNLQPVKTLGGEPFWEIPYTGSWYQAARLETARTWIPPLASVSFSIYAPAHPVMVWGDVIFEFDTGPRNQS